MTYPELAISESPDGYIRMASTLGPYRYRLTHRWGRDGSLAMFAMLNPSTATELADDPTIRRCRSFAQREGLSGMTIVNLYAYRATKPHDLWQAGLAGVDTRGPLNEATWLAAISESDLLIAAWGAHAELHVAARARRLVQQVGGRFYCLGRTKKGQPRHPLYVRANKALEPYPLREAGQ